MLDKEVIIRLINNDKKAYIEVFKYYINSVALTIDAIIQDKDISEDLAMDVLTSVPKKVTYVYAEPHKFNNWIMKTARYKALSYLRYMKIKKSREVEYNPDITNETRELFKLEELKEILTEEEYKIVIMKYVLDYKLEQMSKEIKLSISTIKRRIPPILEKIKNYLNEYCFK